MCQKDKLEKWNSKKVIDELLQHYQIDRLLISILIEKITISEEGEIGIFYKVREKFKAL